ncbi:hypothetical protein JCM33374_g5858 [Metschnikowia sp. JCM 33374]|nr:hypothetical protein JCM33374_g5858 [Metschnikowia sp. JCM 33374]
MSQRLGSAAAAMTRAWHHVDVASDGRTMGRLAESIARTLQGNKLEQKLYWSHTTRPGSLKLVPMERMIANKGYGDVLTRAVKGMIPKNKLRLSRLARLKVYDGDDHPYKENLIAFADEGPEMRAKKAALEERTARIAELKSKFSS